jgi:DNA-binding response OmpR family regulator
MFHPDHDDDDDDFDEPTNPDHRDIRARVLVVEDDEGLRELIIARMRREGFDVLEAGSGYEALEALTIVSRSSRPFDQLDLLVMDVRMPGTTGIEIARMLRAAGWTVPVVLITAFPDRELLVESANLGLTVLAKPFALERLSSAAIAAMMS